MHFGVSSTGTIPLRTKVLSRITAPLRQQSTLPGPVIQEVDVPQDAFESDPALTPARVFETTFDLDVDPLNNEILLHAWGNLECCLPRGTRIAYLYSLAAPAAGDRQASLPSCNRATSSCSKKC